MRLALLIGLFLEGSAFASGLEADPAACGSTSTEFSAHTQRTVELRRGEKLRLALFGNRRPGEVAYAWAVVQRPADSEAEVTNPDGTSWESTSNCEYAYRDGSVPTFTPDVAGTFVVQVDARWAATGETSRTQLEVTVPATDATTASGCNTVGRPSALGLVLLTAATARLRARRTVSL